MRLEVEDHGIVIVIVDPTILCLATLESAILAIDSPKMKNSTTFGFLSKLRMRPLSQTCIHIWRAQACAGVRSEKKCACVLTVRCSSVHNTIHSVFSLHCVFCLSPPSLPFCHSSSPISLPGLIHASPVASFFGRSPACSPDSALSPGAFHAGPVVDSDPP